MPPRHAYWTIILGGKPTAFRAHTREELLPTFKQLQARHPDTVLKWFARGRLWTSQEEEREPRSRARRPKSAAEDRRSRGPPRTGRRTRRRTAARSAQRTVAAPARRDKPSVARAPATAPRGDRSASDTPTTATAPGGRQPAAPGSAARLDRAGRRGGRDPGAQIRTAIEPTPASRTSRSPASRPASRKRGRRVRNVERERQPCNRKTRAADRRTPRTSGHGRPTATRGRRARGAARRLGPLGRAGEERSQAAAESRRAAEDEEATSRMIAHVVLFRPKPDLDEDRRARRSRRARKLPRQDIPVVQRFRVGRRVNTGCPATSS